jgi:hypothetical protein
VSDLFVATFATLALLQGLSLEYKATRARGDLRRILHDRSLAAIMYCKLQVALDSNVELRQLRQILIEYSEAGFYNTDIATRI